MKEKQKFNPSIYQDKDRIYRPVSGCVNIQKLWVWNKCEKKYQSPERGKIYEVRRYELNADGTKRRTTKYFQTLEEGRTWQSGTSLTTATGERIVHLELPSGMQERVPFSDPQPQSQSPTFAQVYQSFFERKISVLSQGTQLNYARYLRLHFQNVLNTPVRDITPRFIDAWLDSLRAGVGKSKKGPMRTSFDHELSVLRSVLRFYAEYYDDPDFRFPVKARHAKDAYFRMPPPKVKDLPEDEFLKFRANLENLKYGKILAPMASVQYYQALRISEVAALHFEDLKLNLQSPEQSVIRVCRHVMYARIGKVQPEIVHGFKNAGGGDKSVKELYLFPEAFRALKQISRSRTKGLIFSPEPSKPFTYRQIQKAYDTAFIQAELPYRGTHVLRHGGCRRVYNATGGDLALAQQLLGNSDLESTLVYAQRDKGALKQHVRDSWAGINPSAET